MMCALCSENFSDVPTFIEHTQKHLQPSSVDRRSLSEYAEQDMTLSTSKPKKRNPVEGESRPSRARPLTTDSLPSSYETPPGV